MQNTDDDQTSHSAAAKYNINQGHDVETAV